MACVINKPFFFGSTSFNHFQTRTTTEDLEYVLVFRISNDAAFSGQKLLKFNLKPYKSGFQNKRHFKSNMISNVKMVISGYWLGPDSEDGWGFVEAVIHRII
ncbi:hypothetical protein LUZ60_013975 [Juncus effusus]|nr:hypothetical protein LUZ60_013975 [Juncus effusus]